jgi:hypothetical protein
MRWWYWFEIGPEAIGLEENRHRGRPVVDGGCRMLPSAWLFLVVHQRCGVHKAAIVAKLG